MKRFKKVITALSLLVAGVGLWAENTPVYTVQSPNAASLGIFGSVPVGLYTGIPEISIPIQEIEIGKMKFPISLDYHLSSVKPNQYPGCLGIGWALNCGGCISRTVRGVYDEKYSTTGNGYYYHCNELRDISYSEFDRVTAEKLRADGDDWYELSADEFSFSFYGYSGNFYLDPSGNWVVVSDQDIKVELTGLTEYTELSSRISRLTSWPRLSRNKYFFTGFTLITPDGCRYTFGGTTAIDFCISYYSRKSDDLIATAWHLKKIQTPEGRELNFTYENDEILVDIRYVPGDCLTTGVYATDYSYLSSINTGRKAFTGYLLFPARMSRVYGGVQEVVFEYKPDYRYQLAYSVYSGDALYWSNSGEHHVDGYRPNSEDPAAQFSILLPQNVSSKENVANLLHAKTLYGIQIKCLQGTSKTVMLSYLEQARRKLTRVAWRTGVKNISVSYIFGGGVGYPIYSIPDNDSDLDMPEYSFDYDDGLMPHGYVLPQADEWGYYNGLSHLMSDTSSYMDTPRNFITTKYETLKRIHYPTGGVSEFEYESHNYGKKETGDHDVENAVGICGGLRVSRIVSKDRRGNLVSDKRFYYSFSRGYDQPSSGILKLQPDEAVTYICGTGSMTLRSKYGFGLPVTNLNSPDVGYSCVIEENFDGDGTSIGYIENRFSNYDTDLFGDSHQDVQALHGYPINTATPSACPYTSNAVERGKLMLRKWYTADGQVEREERYRYARVVDDSFLTATQRMLYFSFDPYRPSRTAVAWLTRTNLYSYLPVEKVVVDHGYEERVSTEYNSYKLKSLEAINSSDGTMRYLSFQYPVDYPVAYAGMVNNHFISPLISVQETTGGSSRRTTWTYRNVLNNPCFVPYVSVEETTIDNGIPIIEYEVLSTDSWGNPTEIVKDNMHSVFEWCNNGQRLKKKVCDIKLAGYNHGVSTTGKLIWEYDYDRNLNLVRETPPNHVSTCYSYDALERLSEVYYEEGPDDIKKIISTNKYYYHR